MQYLLLVLAIVAGAVIVGATTIFFLRARFRETVESVPSNLASVAAPVAVAEEVKAIGTQIDRALSEQRLQGETQRQLLAQKLDSVRQSVEAQRNHVEGLRSELRHEVRRRDAEIEEIRTQIGTIRSAVALPPAGPPALPPAPAAEPAPPASPMASPAPLMAPPIPPLRPPAPVSAPEVDTPPADPFGEVSFGAAGFGEVSFGDSTSPADPVPPSPFSQWAPALPDVDATDDAFAEAPADAPAVFEASPEPPPAESNVPTFESEPSMFEEATFEDVTFAPPTSVSDAPPFEAAFEEPLFEEAPFALPAAEAGRAATPSGSLGPATFQESPFEMPPHGSSAPPTFEEAPLGTVGALDAPGVPAPADLSASPDPMSTRPPAALDEPSDAPVFESQTFASQTFAPVSFPPVPAPRSAEAPSTAAPSAPAALEPTWIARPDRPEPAAQPPSVDDDDDTPTFASADDFFSMPAATAESLPAAPSLPAGLVDLDALAPASPAEPEMAGTVEAEALEPRAEVSSPEPGAAPAIPAPAAPLPVAPPSEAPEPFVAPEGADDLTVITTIDENLQRLLYLEGVTSLEEIAQWGRTRARQIAVAVQVSEETIMNQWVFEAQAAMFNQFSQQAGV